jgi:hypothetical protein
MAWIIHELSLLPQTNPVGGIHEFPLQVLYIGSSRPPAGGSGSL